MRPENLRRAVVARSLWQFSSRPCGCWKISVINHFLGTVTAVSRHYSFFLRTYTDSFVSPDPSQFTSAFSGPPSIPFLRKNPTDFSSSTTHVLSSRMHSFRLSPARAPGKKRAGIYYDTVECSQNWLRHLLPLLPPFETLQQATATEPLTQLLASYVTSAQEKGNSDKLGKGEMTRPTDRPSPRPL